MVDSKAKRVLKKIFPKVGMRIYKTLASVLVIALVYEYLWGGRNPAFACIGAVFGMGSFYQEGIKQGGMRFVGTLLGGLVVIPFYYLYYATPFGIPSTVYLIVGLFFVIYINRMFGAHAAIQPGTVVYFVVMFTVTNERYLSYTIARVIDTGLGVLLSVAINLILPTPADKARREKAKKDKENLKRLQEQIELMERQQYEA
ncbi:MAG: aromatic acid exporter family protein [Bacillota bacterium]